MKKILKITSSLSLTALLLSGNLITAYAKTNKSNESTKTDILENSELLKYKDNPQVKKIIDRIEEEGVSRSSNEVYIKYGMDENGKVVQTQYTPEQYEEYSNMMHPDNVPNTKNFSWIKLTLDAVKLKKKHDYEFTGFYKWINKPYFTMNDIFTIGHD